MSGQQETTRVGKPKRQIKSPARLADHQLEISNKRQRQAPNNEAAKNILAAAQVPKVEKSPTFVGFA
jgi:hypothetical protein